MNIANKINFVTKILLAILLLNLLTMIYIPDNTFLSAFRTRWYLCLDFLEQGILYSGEVYCVQGPVIYIFTFVIKLFFGIENLPVISNFLNILMSVFIILIIARIIERETNKDYFFVILILYSLFIYPYLITGDLHITLTALLFFCGFYILYHTKIRLKRYIAGIFFALSIFTHMTAAPFVLIAIIFYSFDINNLDFATLRKIIKDKALMFLGLRCMLFLLLPLLVTSVVFKVIFPNIFIYTFLTAATLPEPHINFFYKLFHIFSESITLTNYAPYIVVIFLSVAFIKRRDIYTSSAFLGFIILFLVVNAHIIMPVRYLIIPFVFFIITFLIISNNIRSPLYRNLFIASLVLMLIIPHSVIAYFDFQRNQLRNEVEYPLNFIPEQKGRILAEYYSESEYKNFLSNYYNYDLDKLDVLITPTLSGSDYESVARYTGVNADLWISENIIKPINNRNKHIVGKINNREYSLIIFGPPEWQNIRSLHNKVNPNLTYCNMAIPFLNYFGQSISEARLHNYLLFRENSDCLIMKKLTEIYYNEHFESICKKDEDTANFIKQIMTLNFIFIDKECTDGGNLAKNYKKVKEWNIVPAIYTNLS